MFKTIVEASKLCSFNNPEKVNKLIENGLRIYSTKKRGLNPSLFNEFQKEFKFLSLSISFLFVFS